MVVYNKYINDLEGHTISDKNLILGIMSQEDNSPFPEMDRKFYTYMDHFENKGDGTWEWYKYPFVECSDESMETWKGKTLTQEPYLVSQKAQIFP